MAETSAKVGLKINIEKTKVMDINTHNSTPLKVFDQTISEATSFTYLGSVINETGGADDDIKTRIAKARAAFILLKKIWDSREITKATKLKIFNSNVKSVLLYGSETWRLTKVMTGKIQAFINRCLRKILRIFWPNTISNARLWEETQQDPIDIQIRKRKWMWIGHTLRKPRNNITRQALTWNPQGKRRRGRPRNTWRRDTEGKMKAKGKTWQQLERLAPNRVNWKGFVRGLCFVRE